MACKLIVVVDVRPKDLNTWNVYKYLNSAPRHIYLLVTESLQLGYSLTTKRENWKAFDLKRHSNEPHKRQVDANNQYCQHRILKTKGKRSLMQTRLESSTGLHTVSPCLPRDLAFWMLPAVLNTSDKHVNNTKRHFQFNSDTAAFQ